MDSRLPPAIAHVFDALRGGLVSGPSRSAHEVMSATYAAIQYRGGTRDAALETLDEVSGMLDMVSEGDLGKEEWEEDVDVDQTEGVWTEVEEHPWLAEACASEDEELLDTLAEVAEKLKMDSVVAWATDGWREVAVDEE